MKKHKLISLRNFIKKKIRKIKLKKKEIKTCASQFLKLIKNKTDINA